MSPVHSLNSRFSMIHRNTSQFSDNIVSTKNDLLLIILTIENETKILAGLRVKSGRAEKLWVNYELMNSLIPMYQRMSETSRPDIFSSLKMLF